MICGWDARNWVEERKTVSIVPRVGVSGAAETKSPSDAGNVNITRARI